MTKIPTEAIKLALAGGWKDEFYHTNFGQIAMNMEESEDWYRVALDREFWIALFPIGKCNCGKKGRPFNSLNCPEDKWKYRAHEFYELLLTGQNPTEYWNELLANQKGV